MVKKIAIGLLVLGGVFVSWLWWLGGQAAPVGNQGAAEGQNNLQTDADLQTLAWVRQLLQQKGGPLLDSNSLTPINWRFERTVLNLSPAADDESLREYGQELIRVMAPYSQPRENELAVALSMVENQDAGGLIKIRQAQERHLTASQNLVTLRVPKPVAELHLDLINSLLGLAEIDFHLQQILAEPVLALEQAEQYPVRLTALLDAINSLNRFFVERQIIFESGEQAKIFFTP